MKFAALSLISAVGLASASYIRSVVRQNQCSTEFRTFDGTCNNNNNEGAAVQPQLRLAEGDEGEGRPNAREVSNAVFNQVGSTPNDRNMNELVTFFGQFIDHNVVFTPMSGEQFPIEVPEGDAVLEATLEELGDEAIEFRRSPILDGAPLNNITSFIDGSAVYGSDDARAEALREGVAGRLRISETGNLMPGNPGGFPSEPDSEDPTFFFAGDVRVNENPNLMVMHALFLREHNVIAREVRSALPDLDEEELFQTARQINVAQLQKVVYEEWLPAILGDDTGIPEFTGFDEDVEPVVSAFFSTAAFRVGHTLLNDDITRITGRGVRIPTPLRDTFMIPDLLRQQNVNGFLRGMLGTATQEVDTQVVDSVRNFLFTNILEEFEELEGIDLIARNIQRGRDHQIPTYNEARVALGLPARTAFNQISSDADVVASIRSVYDNIDEVEGFVGALAEDRVEGSSFGELLRASWANDFTRLRDGDRFFYLNREQFSDDVLALPRVERLFDNSVSTMREIILDTSNVEEGDLPENVFFVDN